MQPTNTKQDKIKRMVLAEKVVTQSNAALCMFVILFKVLRYLTPIRWPSGIEHLVLDR